MSNYSETLFGRNEEMAKLLNAWSSGKRIYGISGMKMIGKSKLMEEFVNKIQKLEKAPLSLVKIDFRTVETFETLRNNMCETFEIDTVNFEDEDQNYIDFCDRLLKRIDRENKDGRKIIFMLDNLENTRTKTDKSGKKAGILQECFYDKLWKYIFNRLLDRRTNTYIVFSSTESLKFAQKRNVYVSVNVLHLDDDASCRLVKNEWPSIPDHDMPKILKCCRGHPQALINLAIMLEEVRGILLSTDEVFQQLKDRELDLISDTFLPSTDKIDVNIMETIERLTSKDSENLCKLVKLTENKALSMEVLTILFGYKDEVAKFKFDVLRPLHGRCLLKIDMDTKTLCCDHLVSKIILEHYQHEKDYTDSVNVVVVRENDKSKKIAIEHESEKDGYVMIGAPAMCSQKSNDIESYDMKIETSIDHGRGKCLQLEERQTEENHCSNISQVPNMFCCHDNLKLDDDESVKSFTPPNDLNKPGVEHIQIGPGLSVEDNNLYTSRVPFEDQNHSKGIVNGNKYGKLTNSSQNSKNEKKSDSFSEYVRNLSGELVSNRELSEVDCRRDDNECEKNIIKTGPGSTVTINLNVNCVENHENSSSSTEVDENSNIDSVVEDKENVSECRNNSIYPSGSAMHVDFVENHQTNKRNQYSFSGNCAFERKQHSNNLSEENALNPGYENNVFLDQVKHNPLGFEENHNSREDKVTSAEKQKFDTVISRGQYTCISSNQGVAPKQHVRSQVHLDHTRNNGQSLRNDRLSNSTFNRSPEENLTQLLDVHHRTQTTQQQIHMIRQANLYDSVSHCDNDVIQQQVCSNTRTDQYVNNGPMQMTACTSDSKCLSGLDLL